MLATSLIHTAGLADWNVQRPSFWLCSWSRMLSKTGFRVAEGITVNFEVSEETAIKILLHGTQYACFSAFYENQNCCWQYTERYQVVGFYYILHILYFNGFQTFYFQRIIFFWSPWSSARKPSALQRNLGHVLWCTFISYGALTITKHVVLLELQMWSRTLSCIAGEDWC